MGAIGPVRATAPLQRSSDALIINVLVCRAGNRLMARTRAPGPTADCDHASHDPVLMWPTPTKAFRKASVPDNRMVTKPTDTTWQGLLSDTSWRSLSGPPAGPNSARLGQAEIRQARQIVSLLFGPDSRIFIREKTSGEGAGTVHVMVQCVRVLPDRLSGQTKLIELLQDPFAGRRTRVLLIDPSFTLTEEHKRFRFVAMEY